MAIINLDTGELTDEEVTDFPIQEQQTQTQQEPSGTINLDTGKFVSDNIDEPIEPSPKITNEPEGFLDVLADTTPIRLLASGGRAISEGLESAVGSISDVFTGDDRTTRATKELPELGAGGLLSGENLTTVSKLAPVLLTTTQPNEIGKILEANFPNIRIQEDEKGNLIAGNNATGVRVVINQPGVSQLDILQGLGITAAFFPSAKLAALGSAGAGLTAKEIAKRGVLGSVGAGATETVIQAAQESVGGEFDSEDVAIASALGLASEVAVPIIQKVRQSVRAKAVGAEAADVEQVVESIKPATEAVEGLERATGEKVGLFQAQQTQVPSELLKQRVLPQLDAGARKAATELEKQNKSVFDATTKLINTIAPEGSVISASQRFREAAKLAVGSAKQRRSDAVRGLYDDALNLGADVDTSTTSKLITDMLEDAPPGSDFEIIGRRLAKLLTTKTKESTPSLRQLQKAKITMQDMIDAVGDKAVSGQIKKDIVAIKRELVDKMSEASPLFKSADDEFARLTPAVKELEDSILGQVLKVKDTQLKNIAQNIFDPKAALTDPNSIIQAKRAIDSVDPKAWNDLVRVEMQRRLGGLEELINDIPGDFVGNIPGQLRRTLFGNPAQRKALFAGMNSEQKQNFKYLETVLKRASSGRAAGSPTAAFGQAIEKLKGVSVVIRDIIFRPLSTLQKTGESGIFDRNVAALTDVLFDPKFTPQMKKLVKLNPDSPAVARAMTQLIGSAIASREKQENK